MTLLRLGFMALVIVATGLSPSLLRLGRSDAEAVYAASSGQIALDGSWAFIAADSNDNDEEDNEDDDNEDDDNEDEDNGNGGGDGEGGAILGGAPAPIQYTPAPPTDLCARAGQETTLASPDGRIIIRVFPSMSQDLKFSIRQPIDLNSVPPVPGPVVNGFVFQVLGEYCSGGVIAVLPAEVNLGVRYSDQDVAVLAEDRLGIAQLDEANNTWVEVEKQANDPADNYVSATITDMSYYVIYER